MAPRIGPDEGKRRSGVEQLGLIARNLAHPAATFYRTLRADGLEADDAARLTGEFLRILLHDSKSLQE